MTVVVVVVEVVVEGVELVFVPPVSVVVVGAAAGVVDAEEEGVPLAPPPQPANCKLATPIAATMVRREIPFEPGSGTEAVKRLPSRRGKGQPTSADPDGFEALCFMLFPTPRSACRFAVFF